MILRDTVGVLDARYGGNVVATLRAQVSFRTSKIETRTAGGVVTFRVDQQMVALTEPYPWSAHDTGLRFRGQDYFVTGLLWRRRNGRDHHVSVDVEAQGIRDYPGGGD